MPAASRPGQSSLIAADVTPCADRRRTGSTPACGPMIRGVGSAACRRDPRGPGPFGPRLSSVLPARPAGFPRGKLGSRFPCVAGLLPKPRRVRQQGSTALVKGKGLSPIKPRPARSLPESEALKARCIGRRPTGGPVDSASAVTEPSRPACPAAVGMDLGVRQRRTLSAGEPIPPGSPDPAPAPARQQQSARCQRGSPPRQKVVRHYARLRRQHRRNRHAGHRLTTALIKRCGLMAPEQRPIQPMTRSAKETLAEPGTHVWQKRGFNRASTA